MQQVNRRAFIKQTSAAGVGALALTMMPTKLLANSNSTAQLPYSPLQTHLLNRTSFGINAELISKYDELDYKGFIDYQLDHNTIDDSDIENIISQYLTTVSMTTAEIIEKIDNEEINQFTAAGELRIATFLRAVYSKKQLYQVMVEFWNNHFSVYHFDGPVAILKTEEDREVIRPNALGKFSEILQANAKSPAMIYYLDTYSSTKEAPNENYARELMELHTLGVDGPFTHHDIDEVARCFTGWSIRLGTGEFTFYPINHDKGEKQVLGATIAPGGGVSDAEQVLDLLANHESTAAFICAKLCKHFISDNPDKSIIKSTTDKFITTGGDIKQCLRHILISKHFILSRDQKLKRPFHYIISATRGLSADVLNGASIDETFRLLESLGQQPFSWPTPDGYPDYASYWESTTGMLYRWNFINAICFNQLEGFEFNLNQLILEPHTPENVYIQILDKVIYRNMGDTDEINLMQYLINGSANNTVSLTKIQGALAIALGSPYFQLA